MNEQDCQHGLQARKRDVPVTTAEKLALVAEWKASGLSAYAFAVSRDVSVQSLRRWSRGDKLGPVGRPLGYSPAEPATAAEAIRLELKRQAWRRYYDENREKERKRNREGYAKRKRAAAKTTKPPPSDWLKQIRAERTARQQRAMHLSHE
jgi:hypothetical protein